MGNSSTTELTLEEKKAKKSEYNRKYYLANHEKLLAHKKKYNRENKEKVDGYLCNYRKANTEKIAAQRKEYRKANKEKIADANKAYRSKNKEKIAKQKRNHYNQNKKIIIKKNNDRQEIRKTNDKSYRLCVMLRKRQQKTIKGKFKAGSAVRDMGCTGQEACNHLESLFDENMTWENWGTYWHLDHIFPLAAANLKDRAEFLAVNNWRNLQPLEAKANIAKGDKVTPAARRLFNKLVEEFS